MTVLPWTDLITIAIPVFERVDFFPEAFSSALRQTIRCSILVVDNASSHDFFKSYCNKHGEGITRYKQNDRNLGMTGNWNECINLCSTKYLTILHDDDALHCQFVEYAITKIGKECEMLGVNTVRGRNIPESFNRHLMLAKKLHRVTRKSFIFGNIFPFPGIVFPKQPAEKQGGFDDTMFPCADYDFWVKMANHLEFKTTKAPLAFYRYWEQQNTNRLYPIMTIKAFEVARKIPLYGNPLFRGLFFVYLFLINQELRTRSKNTLPLDKVFNRTHSFYGPFIHMNMLCSNKFLRKVFFAIAQRTISTARDLLFLFPDNSRLTNEQ